MLYDTSVNNRDKWINQIKDYTGEKDTANVIQFALSFTLQACRKGEVYRYNWANKGKCK